MNDLGLKQSDLKKITFRLEAEGAVLWSVLDSPPGNILDSEMITSLRRLVAAARDLPGLRLLGFQGNVKHFSYGESVPEHRADRFRSMLGEFHGL